MPIPLKRITKPGYFMTHGSATVNNTKRLQSKKIIDKNMRTTYVTVEITTNKVDQLAEAANLPNSEDYQLEQMLAAGIQPQEINVKGMLDSADVLDPSNRGVDAAILDQMSGNEMNVQQPEPAPAPEPEPAPAQN